MKKSILITLLSFICYHSIAQTDSTLKLQISKLQESNYNAGTYLKRFYGQYSLGNALTLAGIGISVTGALLDDKSAEIYIYSGAAMGLIGIVLQITSHSFVKNAGFELQNNGIVIPLD